MTIEFGSFGTHLETRFAAASVREKIRSLINETDKLVFDFKGVEAVSDPFADECFAKLIFDFDMEYIISKTTFRNASPFIKTSIANAFKERLPQLVEDSVVS